MGFACRFLVSILALIATVSAGMAQECVEEKTNLGVSRILEVDTTGGGEFGTFQFKDGDLLEEGEVILTFDDGPHPKYTQKILKALKEHCTKATFFTVGQMARSYPKVLKEVVDAGHTVGTHTWRHINIQRASYPNAIKDIERGFAAAELAAKGQIAPFFRFPRLRHTKKTRAYLAEQDIAVFSVDVISGDTEFFNDRKLLRHTLAALRQKKKGIILFHDLKKATARIMPTFLRELKKRGYKVVHMIPKQTLNVDALIAANNADKKDEKAKLDSTIALASTAQLDKYFGRSWPKKVRSTKKTKQKKKKQSLPVTIFDLFDTENDF